MKKTVGGYIETCVKKGSTLKDYGFAVFDKLPDPIFLVHRLGTVVGMNTAARQLLRIAKVSALELETFAKFRVLNLIVADTHRNFQNVHLGRRACQVLARFLKNPDFVLIEVLESN